MGDLLSFDQVFQAAIPPGVAEQILDQMENTYGAEFNKNYGHIQADELRNQVCTILSGITPNQLLNAMERLKREKWCPKSLSEFRSWCEGDEFWTANHAWAMATTFLDYPKTKITVFTKTALDTVRLVLQNEGQKSASFSFRDIYNDLVSEAKRLGQKQEIWNRKLELPTPPVVDSVSKAEMAMTDVMKNICKRQQQLMDEGASPKRARQQAQSELNKAAIPALINKAQNKAVLHKPKSQVVLTPFQQLIASGISPKEAFEKCRAEVV